jgi:hypothetical protein
MARLILKVIDVGASAVFIALCTKAFCIHLFKQPSARPVQSSRIIRIGLGAVDPLRHWLALQEKQIEPSMKNLRARGADEAELWKRQGRCEEPRPTGVARGS